MMVLQLNVEKREVFGKKLKKSREEGKLPVVLYGSKIKETTPFFANLSEFKKISKEAGESSVVEVLENGKKLADVMIHDVTINSVKGNILHADLLAVDMSKPVIAYIPLVFEGVAPVEKTGGVLVKVLHELEVEALPDHLPHEIIIDISKLSTFEDRITPADVKLSADVKMITGADEVIALAEPPREDEPEETRTIEDVVVEKKGKKEEEAEEGK